MAKELNKKNIYYIIIIEGVISVIYPSIDKLLNIVGSKYLLVNLISKRVSEMEQTKNYQLKENEYISKKDIGKALEEFSKEVVKVKAN